MKPAILFEKKQQGQVRCKACSHFCVIKPGKTGICGVRKNIGGMLYLLVYGRPAALQIDPIEKKPLYHFLPGTFILSLGTFGCNFRCSFCQNYHMSQFGKDDKSKGLLGQAISELEEWSPKRIVDYAIENRIPSIAYTYNEPAIFVEYAHDIMVLAKENNIKNVYVSNGYESIECCEYIGDYLDAANIDLKSFSNDFYKKLCGAKLGPVLKTIEELHRRGVHVEITTLLIPGENDSEPELTAIAEYISGIDKNMPWHVSRFFPTYLMTDKEPTAYQSLEKAKQVGEKAGLNHIHLGNI